MISPTLLQTAFSRAAIQSEKIAGETTAQDYGMWGDRLLEEFDTALLKGEKKKEEQ
jgi:hypothetical protein